MITSIAHIRSRMRHTPLYPLIRKRRFQAYCVGGPKTGTTSIGSLFAKRFRAAHEPLHAGTMEHVLRALRGTLTTDELLAYLRWRDRELYLEMESSHPTAVFTELLVELFPRSKFILTVREPASWLASFIDEQLKARAHWEKARRLGPRAHFFPALHDLVCKAGSYSFSECERVLEQNGLYPLDGFLSWWADHNRMVLDAVPPDRLLVLQTESLSANIHRIAAFLDVAPAELNLAKQHANRAPVRNRLLQQIDQDFLAAKIQENCSDVYSALAARMAVT